MSYKSAAWKTGLNLITGRYVFQLIIEFISFVFFFFLLPRGGIFICIKIWGNKVHFQIKKRHTIRIVWRVFVYLVFGTYDVHPTWGSYGTYPTWALRHTQKCKLELIEKLRKRACGIRFKINVKSFKWNLNINLAPPTGSLSMLNPSLPNSVHSIQYNTCGQRRLLPVFGFVIWEAHCMHIMDLMRWI